MQTVELNDRDLEILERWMDMGTQGFLYDRQGIADIMQLHARIQRERSRRLARPDHRRST